jgi:hypothetical protein
MSQPADVFHLFGMDSSRTAGKLHAMPKDEAKDAAQLKTIISYDCRLYHFDTNSHMSRQLRDFHDILDKLPEDWAEGRLRKSFRTKFYGTGLLPFYAATVGFLALPQDQRRKGLRCHCHRQDGPEAGHDQGPGRRRHNDVGARDHARRRTADSAIGE